MEPTVNWIAVADNPDSGEFHEVTEHHDKRLVVVKEEKLHVWYDGTYYVGVGTAESVNKGDVFLYPRGYSGDGSPIVTEVVELEDEEGEYDQVVFDIGWKIEEGFILGEPMNMGQLPPPTLLNEQHDF